MGKLLGESVIAGCRGGQSADAGRGDAVAGARGGLRGNADGGLPACSALGVGNLISLPPLIAQREFRPADVVTVVALVTAINQAVFAFAPAIFGGLRDSARQAMLCHSCWRRPFRRSLRRSSYRDADFPEPFQCSCRSPSTILRNGDIAAPDMVSGAAIARGDRSSICRGRHRGRVGSCRLRPWGNPGTRPAGSGSRGARSRHHFDGIRRLSWTSAVADGRCHCPRQGGRGRAGLRQWHRHLDGGQPQSQGSRSPRARCDPRRACRARATMMPMLLPSASA